MEKKLRDLLINSYGAYAPISREYVGEHLDFTIAIGNDETATITMSREAFEVLKSMTLEYED